jgi:hypothetical protein
MDQDRSGCSGSRVVATTAINEAGLILVQGRNFRTKMIPMLTTPYRFEPIPGLIIAFGAAANSGWVEIG